MLSGIAISCYTHDFAQLNFAQLNFDLPVPSLLLCPNLLQVVTAIIRRDSDGKLLLVKRSDQVHS